MIAADVPPVVSGLVFTEVGRAGFDVPRAFLTIQTPLDQGVRARLTLDGGRLPGNQGPLSTVVRFAYAEGPVGGLTWRAGLVLTPWIYYEAQLWQHRLQGPVLSARQGWMVPADFGVAATGRLGAFTVDAGVFNGEGFLKGEKDFRPALQGRLVYHFADTWELAGYGQVNAVAGDAQVVSLARREDAGAVLGQLIRRDGGSWAASGFGWRTLWGDRDHGLDAMGRLDWLPVAADHRVRLTGGMGYRFNPRFRVLADVERDGDGNLVLAHSAYVF